MVAVALRRGRMIGGDQEVVVGNDPRRGVEGALVLDQEPRRGEPSAQLRADELLEPRVFDRDAEEEEPQ